MLIPNKIASLVQEIKKKVQSYKEKVSKILSFRVTQLTSYQISKFPSFRGFRVSKCPSFWFSKSLSLQVFKFPSFPAFKCPGYLRVTKLPSSNPPFSKQLTDEGRPSEKNCMRWHNNTRHTHHRQTLRLRDWICPVGRFSETLVLLYETLVFCILVIFIKAVTITPSVQVFVVFVTFLLRSLLYNISSLSVSPLYYKCRINN